MSAELRTSNERLAVADRETHPVTLDEELLATIDELNATNDDLEARSVELEEVAVRLELERQSSDIERSRLAAVLEGMGDAVVVLAGDGTILVQNQAYAELLASDGDRRMDDEHGRPIPATDSLEARAARGEEFRMVVTKSCLDGARRWFEAVSRRVAPTTAQGSTVLVIRDITDRSLRRLQDEFIATASHELRTPLAVLIGYLHLIERDVEGQAADHARRALQHASELEGLVKDLLDVTRLETGQMRYSIEPIDVRELVQEAVDAARILAGGQRIELSRPSRPVLVDVDRTRVAQVLRILLDNARIHAPHAAIKVALRRRAGRAEVTVHDDGPGIAPEEIGRLFEPFHRVSSSSQPGLGLGLHIAREIARGHRGTLTATSTPGRGADFTLRLPLLAARGVRAGATKRPSGPRAASGGIARRPAAGR